MTKIKSFTVGLPVTELKRAVEWYRRLLREVEEVNPAPSLTTSKQVGCLLRASVSMLTKLKLFQKPLDILSSGILLATDCRLMSCWRNHTLQGAPADGHASALLRRARG
jgi:hypothetical protein